MLKPNCPKCISDRNTVILGTGFRCAFCGTRFFKGDIVDGLEETQTKLKNN